MAITWGGWSAGVRFGIDAIRSGRSITFNFYAETSSGGVIAGGATLGGSVSGNATYYIQGPGQSLVTTRSFTGNWSTTYTARITGTSVSATHSRSISIPAEPVTAPDAPGRPTISAITHNSASTSWTTPAMGNGTFVRYEWQIAANSAFSPVLSATQPTTSGQPVVGLQRATTYYVRVRAVTTTATGAWSQTASFTTLAVAPSAPPRPTVSGITNTTSTLYWGHSSNNGGASLVGYDVQVATASNFSSGSLLIDYTRQTGGSSGVTFPIVALPVNTTLYARVRAENAAGLFSAWSAVRQWSTLPNVPAAPSSVVATRNSDASHSLSWTRNNTSVAPYSNIQIYRSTNGGAYQLVSTVAGTATSWTDTGTSANNQYQWRVRAVNDGGQSALAYSNTLRTTPAAPVAVSASKTGTIDIQVVWSPGSPFDASGYVIQDNPGGSGWVTVASVGNVTSWTHVGPNLDVTHQYRVQAQVTTPSLSSAWSAPSETVMVAGAPLAPTPLLPAGVHNRALPITFTWVHRPTDTSPQSAYQIQRRFNGGAWTTLSGTTSQSHTLNAIGSTGVLEWQIRTRGILAAGYGPWSPVQSINLASAPQVTIISPDGTDHPSSALVAQWSYSNVDPSAQAQWLARLRQGADVLETRSGSGSGSTATFSTILQDATVYRVEVEAAAGSGVWSATDYVEFLTDFALPEIPEVATQWDTATGSVTVLVHNPPEVQPGNVATVHNLIQRRVNGGDWLTLAMVEVDGGWADPVPPLAGLLEYRALAVSSLPSSAASAPEIVTQDPRGRVYFNWGDGFSQVVWLDGNPQLSVTPSRNNAVRARAGRSLPRALIGSQISARYMVSAVITPDSAQTRDIEDLLIADSLLCFRDPDGRKVFAGALSGSVGHTASSTGAGSFSGRGWTLDQVSLSFEQVDHREGLDEPE